MNIIPSTSNQHIPTPLYKQSINLNVPDCAWSNTHITIPAATNGTIQHDTIEQPQPQQQQQHHMTSLSYTLASNHGGELFSHSDNTNWNIHAGTTMNLAVNHTNNINQPFYDYDMFSGSTSNYQAIIQSRGISPPQTTCYGMEKIQHFISTGAATTTAPTLCNTTEDGLTLADATSSSSCTSSVVKDICFSDGELDGNSANSSSMFGHLPKTQLIGHVVQLEQETRQNISSSTQNGTPDHDHCASSPLQDDDQEQESHCCRWANCTFESTTLDELIGHIRDVHIGSGKAAYHCEWTGCTRNRKPFMKRHKMHNHLRTHTGERPFQCTVEGCEKRFSRPDSLNTHMRTHSNIRPYMCAVDACGKAYFHSRSLRKHVKGHEAAGIVVPRSTSRSSTNIKRKQSSPKPAPSSPLAEQHQQDDSTVAPTSTIVPSTTPPPPLLSLSSCSDNQFLLFNSPSSPPPDWDSPIISSLPYTPGAPTFTNPTQHSHHHQTVLAEHPSIFPTGTASYSPDLETPTSMYVYNVPITDPAAMNYSDMSLKSSSNPGGSLYPNPPCSLYDPLSLPYVYAPH